MKSMVMSVSIPFILMGLLSGSLLALFFFFIWLYFLVGYPSS